MIDIKEYWKYTIEQNAEKMKSFFDESAYINWHNTNEHFTVDDFINANCQYPDNWFGEINRIEELNDLIITVTKVYNNDVSFHAVSFIRVKNDKIISIDEYWGADGEIPDWRINLNS